MRSLTARARRAAPAALVALVAALLLGACASSPERPTLPSEARDAAPKGVAPEGLTEYRDNLAAMRSDQREAMGSSPIQSRSLAPNPVQEFFGKFFGAVGSGIAKAASLLAFGL